MQMCNLSFVKFSYDFFKKIAMCQLTLNGSRWTAIKNITYDNNMHILERKRVRSVRRWVWVRCCGYSGVGWLTRSVQHIEQCLRGRTEARLRTWGADVSCARTQYVWRPSRRVRWTGALSLSLSRLLRVSFHTAFCLTLFRSRLTTVVVASCIICVSNASSASLWHAHTAVQLGQHKPRIHYCRLSFPPSRPLPTAFQL